MIFSTTRVLKPHEYRTAKAIVDSNDRSVMVLRVPVTPEAPGKAFEIRPTGKANPGCVTVSLRDELDDVIAQAIAQPEILGTFTMDFLGAEYWLEITKAPEKGGNKKAAKKRAKPTDPQPSPEERAARTKAYSQSGAAACPNCQSTSIVKSAVVAERCRVVCQTCEASWIEYLKLMALEAYKLKAEAVP